MIEGINKEFKIQVTTLSPLHIGGAQEKHLQNGLDYISLDNSFYKIDIMNLCKEIDANDVAEAIANGSLSSLIKKHPHVKKKLVPINVDNNPLNEIKALIKDGFGKPYLPGSSLKGALSSVILGNLKISHPKENQNELIGNFENAIFRHIKIGDAYFRDDIQIYSSKIFNLTKVATKWVGAWKHGGHSDQNFNPIGVVFFYECIPTNTQALMSIRILNSESKLMEMLSKWSKTESNKTLPKAFNSVINAEPLTHIFKIINEKSAAYLKKEIAFFKKYPLKETEKIISKLNILLSKIPDDETPDTCIMRIAHGSGFHSITGDWQYDDFDNTGFHQGERNVGKKKYKSRKLLFSRNGNDYDFMPLGFIQLSTKIIEKDESIVDRFDKSEMIIKEEQKTVEPEFFTGAIKEGRSILDAVVISNNPNKVEVYLNSNEKITLDLTTYSSPIEIGRVIQVKVNQYDKKRLLLKQIGFVRFK